MNDDLPDLTKTARRLHDVVTHHALTQKQARAMRIQALKDLVHEFEWVALPYDGIKLPGYKLRKGDPIWPLLVFLPFAIGAGIMAAWGEPMAPRTVVAAFLSLLCGFVWIGGWRCEADGNCVRIASRRSGDGGMVVYAGNASSWNPPWVDPANTFPPLKLLDVREALEHAAISYEAVLVEQADPEDLEKVYSDAVEPVPEKKIP